MKEHYYMLLVSGEPTKVFTYIIWRVFNRSAVHNGEHLFKKNNSQIMYYNVYLN